MKCCIDGCMNEKVVAHGLCRTHYGRMYRTGTTSEQPRKIASIEDRFWKKVNKAGEDDCWEWMATKTRGGYGSIGIGSRERGKEMAHRASYRIHYGEIPDGLWVLHSCDNRSCVNPKHLRLGTALDNTNDAIIRNRLVPPPVMRGESNCKAKLTKEDVEYIRSHPEIKAEYLAAKFGVHFSTIHNVVSGRTWRIDL